jgi:diguanylate cyclase (GGDEF)-like protein/PAS domain S-box-containing protein
VTLRPMDLADLQTEHALLLDFLYMCPIGILKLDRAGDVVMLNPHAAQLLLPVARSPLISNLFAVLENCAPELRNLTSDYSKDNGVICKDHRIALRPKGPGPRMLAATLVKISESCLIAVLSDVTDQVEQENRLRQTESWFAALMSGVNEFAMFYLDAEGRIISWNESGLLQTGYTKQDVLGHTMHLLYDPTESRPGRAAEQVDAARREGWHLDEGWCLRKDGSRFWCQILAAARQDLDGPASGFSVVLRDSTQRHVTSDELRRMITTDHLTGAINRAHFQELVEREIRRWKRYKHPVSLVILDIDHFKNVNDTFGHKMGDLVLQHVVATGRLTLRTGDVLARIGGEEFAVLLPNTDLTSAVEAAERLRQAIAQTPFLSDGQAVGITISLGCAVIVDTLDDLFETADKALYQAKWRGRNRVEGPAGLDVIAV